MPETFILLAAEQRLVEPTEGDNAKKNVSVAENLTGLNNIWLMAPMGPFLLHCHVFEHIRADLLGDKDDRSAVC